MSEKKGETAKGGKSNAKKANLLDHNSIKHILDESVTEVVTSKGYVEDVRMSNIRLLIGAITIVIALFAQFYNKKFPENRNFLICCIVLFLGLAEVIPLPIIFSAKLLSLFAYSRPQLLIIYTKEKNVILFTYPPPGSFNTTGLVVSSKLPRFSDMYTLSIASADPQSISAKPPVEFTKSVTQWFTKDGMLVEGLFWKDVEGLVNDYAKENKKSK